MGIAAAAAAEEIRVVANTAKSASIYGVNHVRLVNALFELIRQKDKKLATHCENVALYSIKIGKTLGLSKEQIKILNDGAMLHDVGKIMVDTIALNKRGKLNEREFIQIKGHAAEGAEIMETFHLDKQITDIVWHHHERWDGNGYPDGLREEEIPLLARIVTVSDAIDAMNTDRPYQGRLAQEDIIQELIKSSGTQFDKRIVDSTILLIQNGMML